MSQEFTEMMSGLTSRVLVVCSEADPCAPEDPADRCWRLAEALAASHDVILALPSVSQLSHPDFAVVYYNDRNIGLIARDSDVAVCDWRAAAGHPRLHEAGRPVAVDLASARQGSAGPVPDEAHAAADPGLEEVLASADYFFCASERDRLAWLESLKAAGRVNEHTLDGDSGLRGLLEVVRPEDRARPLTDYCAAPGYARDRGTAYNRSPVPSGHTRGPGHYWRRASELRRAGGLRAVCARGAAVIRRKITGRAKKD